jgi:hypothetical protein
LKDVEKEGVFIEEVSAIKRSQAFCTETIGKTP